MGAYQNHARSLKKGDHHVFEIWTPCVTFFDMIFDMGFCIDKLVGGPNASPVWDTHGMELHPCRRAMVFTALAIDASSKKLLGSYLGWVVGES